MLAGTASGTIIALIPNAVLGAILKYFAEYKIIEMIIHAAQIFQLATPLIIGGLIAFQFGLTPQKMMIAGGAAFAGSGVIKFNSEVKGFIGAGTGDIINIMITASVAVLLLLVIDKNSVQWKSLLYRSLLGRCRFVWHVDLSICDTNYGCHRESD